ncbi:MAG: tRNA pseudouridine(13) synthase TruD [Candidatus ainarchaeum sp.]|nr:tRNA pseudouridine(13) synthase TruD [Candidatus ainarchaeum sp.]
MLSELSYLSKSPGTGGSLKNAPEDFAVEEILADGTVLELDRPFSRPDEPGRFVHFALQKRGWSTSSALSEIAKRLGMGQRNFNAAGMKDKTSISTQLASAEGASKGALLSLSVKDIRILGAWGARDRVKLGALLGNRFTIRVAGLEPEGDAGGRVRRICAELNGQFPNYFGEQRFGSARKNTHKIGEKLLQGKFDDAVRTFLCGNEGEGNALAMEARKELAATGNYAAALKTFPKHLRLERSMLAHLAAKPDDSVGALRRLPRNILLLFIHAFQSHMFNLLLSERIAEGPELEKGEYYCGETLGFPDISKAEAEGWITTKLIGYDTPVNGREQAMLDRMGMARDAFRMKAMPEIASKGTYRTLLAPMKDFNFSNDTFRFALPAGAYATVALREFMDRKG